MNRLNEMQTFLAVVDQGGFTGAAKRMSCSKSAISKSIAVLEARLGARLLNRTTRRVSATEIGLAYYDKVKRIVDEADEADAMVSAMQLEPSGALRVSSPLSFGITHLSPAINQFLEKYTEINLEMLVDDAPTNILAGGFDVGIKIGVLPDSSLIARKLAESKKLLLASKSYLAKYQAPKTIADLANHTLLHYSYLSTGNYWNLLSPSGEVRQVRAGGRFTVNSSEMLVSAAQAGLGIAQIPEFSAYEKLRDGSLVQVLEHLPALTVGIYAVYPEGKYIQPKLRAFIDFMVEHFKNTESWL